MEVEVAREQSVLDGLYRRLDELRARTERELDRVRRTPTAGTPAARTEREAFNAMYVERLAALRAAEERLCFGRLDTLDGATTYVGRIGLSDGEQRQLLTDWRAPAAEPFYQATAANPLGVVRRRHLMTSGRAVTGVEDDVLDLDSLDSDAAATVQGDGALMTALAARRSGRMRDIVATIQAEQDRIIRAPLPGVLVVSGGPGCGKTVVGLHRAAYLLYTHRDRIARSGVLVVGPNPLFLRYIDQVLPALGETSAVLVSPGGLYPGVDATARDEERVAAVKGDLRMADVLARAVSLRQRVPDGPIRLDVDGTTVTMTPRMVQASKDRAKASRRPHNRARRTFALDLLDRLAGAYARALGIDLQENRGMLIETLRDARDVRREVNLAWMPVTPERLLSDLWADPDVLAAAAPRLSATERELLRRERGAPWTIADAPLLDEAAELLGDDDEAERLEAARAQAARRAEIEYARGVLEMTGGSMVTAETIVDRYAAAGTSASVAERAAADREWTFGHVVVDEAQELSPMAWRVVMRRCPSRSMTVVGDLDQTGSAAGVRAWGDVFDRYARGRWQQETLTVNYRTPRPVMELAVAMLEAAGIAVTPPRSARDGDAPAVVRVDDVARAVGPAVAAELTGLDGGRLAVVAPRAARSTVGRAVERAVGATTVGHGLDTLDAPVAVLTVPDVKGLEFDVVIVVEPAQIVAEGAGAGAGERDLYVALTRATRRLVVVHRDPLPPGMAHPAVVD